MATTDADRTAPDEADREREETSHTGSGEGGDEAGTGYEGDDKTAADSFPASDPPAY